jgi:hypothetical protein
MAKVEAGISPKIKGIVHLSVDIEVEGDNEGVYNKYRDMVIRNITDTSIDGICGSAIVSKVEIV